MWLSITHENHGLVFKDELQCCSAQVPAFIRSGDPITRTWKCTQQIQDMDLRWVKSEVVQAALVHIQLEVFFCFVCNRCFFLFFYRDSDVTVNAPEIARWLFLHPGPHKKKKKKKNESTQTELLPQIREQQLVQSPSTRSAFLVSGLFYWDSTWTSCIFCMTDHGCGFYCYSRLLIWHITMVKFNQSKAKRS